MKTLREDILTHYRDRIATGERTKLTQDDLQLLIETFVEQLQGLKTQAKIKALCEAEIALLEEGYPKTTIGKVYLPLYRKAIKAAVADGKLPMTKATSRQYVYTKRESGETEEAHDHRALDFLKYDNATYSAIAGQSAQRNNQKQDNLKPVNPDLYLAKASKLLLSDDPFELAVGIAAVTGRRFSEVMDKGTLAATDQSYWVSFAGQLKKRSREADSYFTPCLVPAVDVLAAIDRFRTHPRITRVAGKTVKDLNRSLASSVKRLVQKHFGETGIVPVLEGEADVTIHNLRGVYGEICVHFFCPPSRGVARFVQERLGHVISDEELKRGNSSATQHYFHYYLVNGDEKHIGSRGMKLTDEQGLPMADEQGLPMAIEAVRKSQPEILPEPLPETRPVEQSDSPIAITPLSQQIETLTLEIQRIWSHVSTMNTASPQAPATTDTAFFTREIESLRAELATLRDKRDQAAAQLEQMQAENESLQQQFAAERLAYQKRINGLTELLNLPPSIAQSVTKPIAVVEQTPKSFAPTSQPQAVESIDSPTQTAVAHTPVNEPAISVQHTQLKPRREYVTRAGSADQRVEAAMLAIQDWNRQHDSDSDRFAITQSLLQKTTGSNMPAVKRVMEAFMNEIYEHNSQYGLDADRHNYGKDFGEIKIWVQARL